MVVFPGVWTTNDHHNIITGFLVKVFIANRGLEQVSVFIDPFFEVEWPSDHVLKFYPNLMLNKG
jgi:hypothetical protein